MHSLNNIFRNERMAHNVFGLIVIAHIKLYNENKYYSSEYLLLEIALQCNL